MIQNPFMTLRKKHAVAKSCNLPNHATHFKLLELRTSIYFDDSSLDTIQTWKEKRFKYRDAYLMRYLFGLHFSNVLWRTSYISIFIQYDRIFSPFKLIFGLEEWMANQWLRQIERKRDTTFSFFMQNLCIFSNKNCQAICLHTKEAYCLLLHQ